MLCRKCKKDISLDQFSKDKNSKTGFSTRCKPCQSSNAKRWYLINAKRQHDLARQPNMRFNFATKTASKRNLEWGITRNQYYDLIKQPCYYCHSQPKDTTVGVGLDRLDNNMGYILTNVVPCCGPCNVGRNANFTPEEWQVAIRAIMQHRNSNS